MVGIGENSNNAYLVPSDDEERGPIADGSFSMYLHVIEKAKVDKKAKADMGKPLDGSPTFVHQISAKDKRQLKLSIGFAKQLDGIVHRHCQPCLVDKQRRSWPITISSGSIKDGWQDFYDFYGLKIDNVVILTHHAWLVFEISVMNDDTEIEKPYPTPMANPADSYPNVIEVDFDEFFYDTYNRSAKELGILYIPRAFEKVYDPRLETRIALVLMDPRDVEWEMELRSYNENAAIYIAGDWAGVAKANKWRVGQTAYMRAMTIPEDHGMWGYMDVKDILAG